MEKKKSISIVIIGCIFIIISILFLFAFFQITPSSNTIFKSSLDFPGKSIFSGLYVGLIVYSLFGFAFFLTTGIGVLKLKPWAYYMGILACLSAFVGVLWSIWLLGPQYYTYLHLIAIFILYGFILLYFLRPKCRDIFQISGFNLKKISLIPKVFIVVSTSIILMYFLSIISWSLYAKIKYDKLSLVLNLKPEKSEYKIDDKEVLLSKYKKIEIFGNSLYIPKTWEIGSIYSGDSNFSWVVAFVPKKDSDAIGGILIESKGFQSHFLAISKSLKHKSLYNFEKRLNYPNWTPIYLIFKTIGVRGDLQSIEEATSPSWKGFVKIGKFKNKDTNLVDCSLYSLNDDRTSSLSLAFKDEAMTIDQAKTIIASFEFQFSSKDASILFNDGKEALSEGKYETATLNFLNALYIKVNNPEYAYYLARSSFEDDSEVGRRGRLYSSKHFLEFAIGLNSDYQEAKELLKTVKKEIEIKEKDEKH